MDRRQHLRRSFRRLREAWLLLRLYGQHMGQPRLRLRRSRQPLRRRRLVPHTGMRSKT